MQHNEVDCATACTASTAGRSGKGTADKSNGRLRIGRRGTFGRFIGGGLLISTLAILPIQATEHDNQAFLPTGFLDVSTISSNGDQNPYGVAFVPRGFPSGGKLSPGDILVSNFNNAGAPPTGNIQGTGTTITRVAPDGETTTFFTGVFQSPTDGGLTTALGVLKKGFVVVGQLPNNNGTPEPGSLLFIDKTGTTVVLKYTNLSGPWDLAIDDDFDHAKIFVSNVLSGTVVRLDVVVGPSTVSVVGVTEIAHGYMFGLNGGAFVVGPTGLAFDEEHDVLYVASTADNEIFKILHAEATNISVLKGVLVFNDPHLHNPLGLALTPNGHLLTSNGDSINPPVAPQLPSQIVEFTKDGHFVGQLSIDSVAGAAFGIAVARQNDDRARVAAVNDDDNTIIVLGLNAEGSE